MVARSKRETTPTPVAGPHFTIEMQRTRVLLWALIIANVGGTLVLAALFSRL